mgnify:FL=1
MKVITGAKFVVVAACTLITLGSVVFFTSSQAGALELGEGTTGIPTNQEVNNYFLNQCNRQCFYDTMYIGNGNGNQTITATSHDSNRANVSVTWRVWIGDMRRTSVGTGAQNITIQEGTRNNLDGTNRLSGHPGVITYGTSGTVAETYNGHKRLVDQTYNVQIDTTGWADGSTHNVCTEFASWTNTAGGFIEPSESYCASITLNIPDGPWTVNAQSYIKGNTHGQDTNWHQPNPENRSEFLATPGDILNFKHDIRANAQINSSINYTVADATYHWPGLSGGRTLQWYGARMDSSVSGPISS